MNGCRRRRARRRAGSAPRTRSRAPRAPVPAARRRPPWHRARCQHPGEPHQDPRVGEVRLERIRDTRVWILTATLVPSCRVARWTCPIEAAANASSSIEAKTRSGRSSYSSASTVCIFSHGMAGRVRAQRRKLVLIDLAVFGGKEVDVDEGRHLADLHRGALHLAQDGGHPRLEVPGLQALLCLLVGARDVGGHRSGVAGGLGADRRAELRRAPDPRLRDAAALLLGLRRLRDGRPALLVGPELVDALPPSGLALPLPGISISVAAHCPHTFSILAPERSLPIRTGAHCTQRWHRTEPHSRSRSATPSIAGDPPAPRGPVPGSSTGRWPGAALQVPARQLRVLLSQGTPCSISSWTAPRRCPS